MRIGGPIALLVIGAILAFGGLQDRLNFANLEMIGYILMGGGLVWLVIGLVASSGRKRSQHEVVTGADGRSTERTVESSGHGPTVL